MGKETVNKRRAKLKPVMNRMNIMVRQCWRHIYLGARHVLGKHHGIMAARPHAPPLSFCSLALEAGSGRTCAQMLVTTLAGRGWRITEGGSSEGRESGKARDVALCTHPGPPEQGERGRVDQMAAHDKGVNSDQGTLVPELHPEGRRALWAACECVLDGLELSACAAPPLSVPRPESGLDPELLLSCAWLWEPYWSLGRAGMRKQSRKWGLDSRATEAWEGTWSG